VCVCVCGGYRLLPRRVEYSKSRSTAPSEPKRKGGEARGRKNDEKKRGERGAGSCKGGTREREPARRRRRRRRRRVLLNVQFGPRGNGSLVVVHQSSFNRSLHHIQSQRAKKLSKKNKT